MKKLSSCLPAFLASLAFSGAAQAALVPTVHRTPAGAKIRSMAIKPQVVAASGVGLNLDVMGRLNGSGNTLFKTSLDVANNTGTATQVDAYFDTTISGQSVEFIVSITAAGIVSQGGGTLDARAVFHSDDFVDDLKNAGLITQDEENAGMLGSLFVIYNSPQAGLFDQIGQGSVQARFYSSNFGGTIGVSANGHELTTSEPTALVGIARNTVHDPNDANSPQVTTNFFIDNEGFANNDGSLTFNPITVRLTGYSNATGNLLPNHVDIAIDSFQTAVVPDVNTALGADTANDDTAIVFVDIISGTSAITGLSSTNDAGTKDPSAAQLRPADWNF